MQKLVNAKTSAKKSICIILPFEGEPDGMILRQRLISSMERIYYVAKLVVTGMTKSMYLHRPRHYINDHVTSHRIYQFICLFGHTHVGRSNWTIHSRVMDHLPIWLQNQLVSSAPISVRSRKQYSSISKQIIETEHRIDINTALKTLYIYCSNWILKFVDVLNIPKFRPTLCVQFSVILNFPW